MSDRGSDRGLPAAILVADGNPADLELILRALGSDGHAAHAATVLDGESVLDFVFARGAWRERAGAPPLRLLLLDLRLPGVDGLEVLREIKRDPRTRALPVVILSASADERDVARAYRAGANGYVAKPMDFGEFRDAVGGLVSYWLDLNVPPPAPAFLPD